eukprot:9851394-Alexandrium_andersonii.AAC.1
MGALALGPPTRAIAGDARLDCWLAVYHGLADVHVQPARRVAATRQQAVHHVAPGRAAVAVKPRELHLRRVLAHGRRPR